MLNGTYTYDEIGQLIREDTLWENKTIVYAYDLGGNFTNRKEYAYTTGAPENLVNEVVYQY